MAEATKKIRNELIVLFSFFHVFIVCADIYINKYKYLYGWVRKKMKRFEEKLRK